MRRIGEYNAIHISEVPPRLIAVRDNWRDFWQWIPIAGWIYRRFVYVRLWDRWVVENNIGFIMH